MVVKTLSEVGAYGYAINVSKSVLYGDSCILIGTHFWGLLYILRGFFLCSSTTKGLLHLNLQTNRIGHPRFFYCTAFLFSLFQNLSFGCQGQTLLLCVQKSFHLKDSSLIVFKERLCAFSSCLLSSWGSKQHLSHNLVLC